MLVMIENSEKDSSETDNDAIILGRHFWCSETSNLLYGNFSGPFLKILGIYLAIRLTNCTNEEQFINLK